MTSVQELRAAVSSSAQAKTDEAPAASDKPAPKVALGPAGLLVLAAAIGLSAGIALDRFLLPHHAQPAPVATAVPQKAALGALVASGSFIQPDANNPLRRGTGGVSVYDGEVVLGADFAVTPGPDYRVLLVPKAAIRADADIANTMYIDLGALAAFKGGQHYAVPAGVDLANYPSVVIWCAPYAALISTADLSFAK
jgi:hypothetical protein